MALRVGKKYSLRRQATPQRIAAAQRRKASLRRTAIGTTILAVILVACGAGYTWYMGEHQAPVAAAKDPVAVRRVEMKPVAQDPNANVGVSVQQLTSPVQPGQNASLSVRTNQLATCTIVVLYGTMTAVDSGLTKKTADDYGTVSWSWTVASAAPIGKGTVKVDCAKNKKTGSVTGDLVIAR